MILTGLNVCLFVCLLAGLLAIVGWMSVSALLCTDRSTLETMQETEDSTKRIFLLPHGRGESDPTVPMVWAVQGSKVDH